MACLRFLRRIALCPALALLAGCDAVLMHPAGDVALQQRNLILASTGLMLLIVLPVMALTALFAWRYRQSNTTAAYEPDWHHSTQLEVVIWSAPLVIVIALGALTWISTHLLDPYRPIGRIAAAQPLADGAKPLTVEVVALDWKWLFIYPELGIASVNALAAPVDRQLAFRITASSVMNSFFIPALAGQIYAMPGMETKLHAVINSPGDYDGLSANYSGAGFSDMRFKFHAQSPAEFDAWVQKIKAAGGELDRTAYLDLAKPSQKTPVRGYGSVAPDLYTAIVNLCVDRSRMCLGDMMQRDARGGSGLAGALNVVQDTSEKHTAYVGALCTAADRRGIDAKGTGLAGDLTPPRLTAARAEDQPIPAAATVE